MYSRSPAATSTVTLYYLLESRAANGARMKTLIHYTTYYRTWMQNVSMKNQVLADRVRVWLYYPFIGRLLLDIVQLYGCIVTAMWSNEPSRCCAAGQRYMHILPISIRLLHFIRFVRLYGCMCATQSSSETCLAALFAGKWNSKTNRKEKKKTTQDTT